MNVFPSRIRKTRRGSFVDFSRQLPPSPLPASRQVRRSGSGIWFGVSFPFGATRRRHPLPSKLRWHSRGVTPLMRLRCIDLGKSVTAKLNSARPSFDLRYCPRVYGFRQRQVRRKVTTPSFDSIARQLFPRFRLEIRARRCTPSAVIELVSSNTTIT